MYSYFAFFQFFFFIIFIIIFLLSYDKVDAIKWYGRDVAYILYLV